MSNYFSFLLAHLTTAKSNSNLLTMKVHRILIRSGSNLSPSNSSHSPIFTSIQSSKISTHVPLTNLIDIVETTTRKAEIDNISAREMYETSTVSIFFKHESWHTFFNSIKPCLNTPAPEILEYYHITTFYEVTMRKIILSILKWKSGIFECIEPRMGFVNRFSI